jgi:Holliday junction resolvase RusA-like endonuclease
MFDCALRVEILAEFPIPISWSKKRQAAALLHGTWPAKKPDWDNCAKLVTDACNQIVWRDDALIVDCWVRKTYSDQPKITLTAYAMEAIVQTPFESAQRV